MNHNRSFHWMIASALLVFAALACGGTVKQSEPMAPIAPITIGSDLTQINICRAVP